MADARRGYGRDQGPHEYRYADYGRDRDWEDGPSTAGRYESARGPYETDSYGREDLYRSGRSEGYRRNYEGGFDGHSRRHPLRGYGAVGGDIGYGEGSLAQGAGNGATGPSGVGGYSAYGAGSGERFAQDSYNRRSDADIPTYESRDVLARQAMGEDRSWSGRGHGEHRGKGPRNYKRTDQRIHDDVNDRLTDDSWLNAQDIEVAVSDGDVTLTGTVNSREDKRRAEQIAEAVSGVENVQNNLRVQRQGGVEQSSSYSTASGKAGSEV